MSYVVPLTYISNLSLIEDIFPSGLKVAKLVPIFKSDKVTNYGPISVLCLFSEIYTKIIKCYG